MRAGVGVVEGGTKATDWRRGWAEGMGAGREGDEQT